MIEYDHYGFDTRTIQVNVINNSGPILPPT